MSNEEFGTFSFEDLATEDSRLNNEGMGNFLDQFFPMPDVKPGQTGSVAARILPPVKGGRLFQYTRIHMINGRKVHCPRPLINGKWDRSVYCPICEYYALLWRKADKLDEQGLKAEADKLKDEARQIKPIERYYYNAIARKLVVEGVEKLNQGPRILSIGKILHKMIVRAIVGDENEAALGDITNIRSGYDFIVRKEMNGEYPKYDRSSFAREPSPLGTPDEIKIFVANLHDLTKLRTLKTTEELEEELAIHRGLIPDKADNFDVDKFDSKFKKSETKSVEDAVDAIVTAVEPAASETGVVAENDAPSTNPDLDVVDPDLLAELGG